MAIPPEVALLFSAVPLPTIGRPRIDSQQQARLVFADTEGFTMPTAENHQRVRFGRRASDRWFNLLVETMQEGLAVYDNQGRLVFVNKSLCRMQGYARE